MKIVFMGTPDFAVGALEEIIKAGHEVVLVVTQPDKQKGRGKEVSFSPVKECAISHGIECFQPRKIKEEESVLTLRKYEADIFVVAAFGQILSKEILEMPKFGCVNIHASLLPKYRGAAPIQWAILDGEKETGVTIMQMDEGLDTGDMLYKEHITIAQDETGASLFEKLADLGAKAIVHALPLIEAGTLIGEKQEDSKSSYASMLKKELGLLDFSESAIVLERKIRGLNSWPSAYTYYKGKTLKVWSADVIDQTTDKEPGSIIELQKDRILVATKDGILCLKEVQLEGKKKMQAEDFLRGNQMEVGIKLGGN
ncbi:MAG: methionyl-tRNA formyltransferase [Lachnospiraceae bacterium]